MTVWSFGRKIKFSRKHDIFRDGDMTLGASNKVFCNVYSYHLYDMTLRHQVIATSYGKCFMNALMVVNRKWYILTYGPSFMETQRAANAFSLVFKENIQTFLSTECLNFWYVLKIYIYGIPKYLASHRCRRAFVKASMEEPKFSLGAYWGLPSGLHVDPILKHESKLYWAFWFSEIIKKHSSKSSQTNCCNTSIFFFFFYIFQLETYFLDNY